MTSPEIVELHELSKDEMSGDPMPERRDSSLSTLSFSKDGIDTLGWATTDRRSFLSSHRGSSNVSLSEDGVDTMGWGARDQEDSESCLGFIPCPLSPGGEEEPQNAPPPGPGPLRFAPRPYQQSVRAQIEDLFAHERCCFDSIKDRWENSRGIVDGRNTSLRRRQRRSSVEHSKGFTNAQYLHFARSANFDEEEALRLMRSTNRRYLRLTCEALEAQLRTKTIFIPPGLQSREGYEVFYMRPSRYFPKQMKTSDVIDNLAYIMQVMLERERSSKEGIAFLANMADWEMANFSTGYCLQFMKTLQAEHFPVEVRIFLIVDPPNWFDKIWNIMKKMLTTDFQKRVRMIPSSELAGYLGDGYEEFLPDEMEEGSNPTDGIISDFIEYRKYIERCDAIVM